MAEIAAGICAKPNFRYWLAEHPIILSFRWDHNVWGSSFVFLALSVFAFLLLVLFLKIAMKFRSKPLPLGRIPAIHNFIVLVMSVIILAGYWEATAVELRETRWLWRKRRVVEWLICFPLGIRSTGRVFFWSYVFYLTKYFEMMDLLIQILAKQSVTFFHIVSGVAPVFVCFFWLEFSQSLQILYIVMDTITNVILYGKFFFGGDEESQRPFPRCTSLATRCRIFEFVVTIMANLWVAWLHLRKEGCNGMVGCVLNACWNVIFFLFFLRFSGRQSTARHPPAVKEG
ncbi:hypothetical protein SUGI_1178060 [Cryptomeria japonica]|uniref:elongation of fatty acids protein 3-like n=1 Tax=Cryptomeria japonica TaxID=3369 RepID=UPI002414CA3C|nr:elongation of fatty acids protein 3-like [Cryptomeria japonica]GLJ54856.1 hypothetical protein SUGI_1178060 [Cryptomeria japonica]